MRHVIILASVAMLSACGPTPAPDDAAVVAATPAGPFFTVTADQVSAAIESFGAPWAGGVRKDALRDTKTGGTVRTVTTMDGSAQIFSWPSGQVWQVRLIGGGAGGCGDIARMRAALPRLVDTLSPSAKPTQAELQAVSDYLNDPGTADHKLPGASVSVVGGCRMWLTLTAA